MNATGSQPATDESRSSGTGIIPQLIGQGMAGLIAGTVILMLFGTDAGLVSVAGMFLLAAGIGLFVTGAVGGVVVWGLLRRIGGGGEDGQ